MKAKTIKLRLLTLFLLLTASLATTYAQESLEIDHIFEKYGKRKGATTVVLSGEVLLDYRLDNYRSITLRYDREVADDIQQSLEADKRHARKIKEVVSNGIITSGYYQLPEENKRINRYILFKIGNDGSATLIYMVGSIESEELINRLFLRE